MLKIGNLTKNGQTHFLCATDGKVETNGRRSELIHRKDRGITRQCTWNVHAKVCSKKRKSSTAAE